MAKKNHEETNGIMNVSAKGRTTTVSPRFAVVPPSAKKGQSPSSPRSSPRTSPGLLAGHYAGCKWSEPPLPSALPRPPQHWMSAPAAAISSTLSHTFQHKDRNRQRQPSIEHQLKILLNVQA